MRALQHFELLHKVAIVREMYEIFQMRYCRAFYISNAKIPRFLQNFINIDGFKNQALKIGWFNQTYADSAPRIDTLTEAIDTLIILTFHITNHAKWTLILGAPFRQVWSVWDPIVLGFLLCQGS